MRSKMFLLLPAACLTALSAVPSVFASAAQTLNLPDPSVSTVVFDDEVPDVTARVSRISFIRGEVQIRRSDSQDWERATLNLPIVEGDELTTSNGGRIEIQFNTNTYLRLDENSYLKVANLKEDGIAVSLPEGKMSVTVDQFSKDVTYFEIDAPNTTVAVQKSGFYSIDAGRQGDDTVRVSVLESGEARIYSNDSGFTLKSGRSARVFIAGDNAGEWDTAAADRGANEFDKWAFDRDRTIALNLKSAHYGKYYDQDMYGAEDLNSNGEWVYTKKYGYVWRPYRTTTSSYSDWSPYRYGTWRWVSPYGWTWVNDEPWGWATYHHGRWFFDDGYWSWSPYGAFRNTRSWWRPALVVFTSYGNNFCWYPIPYSYAYYNYNHHGQWSGGHQNGGNGNGNGGPPVPVATPDPRNPRSPRLPPLGSAENGPITRRVKVPPLGIVPPTGVVMVDASEFGRGSRTRTPPLATANAILTKSPNDQENAPQLPTIRQFNGRRGTSITVEPPPVAVRVESSKTGAMQRSTDRPLDNELRNTRVFGNRPPAVRNDEPVRSANDPTLPRQTGAVDRVPANPVRQPRVETPPAKSEEPVRQPPVYVPPTRKSEETPRAPVREERRYDPPMQRESPRYVPPVRNDPPPRNEAPPTQRQPPRNDPPPTRNEPKPDSKPAPPADRGEDRKKDGR